jgi:hypothetical protein
MTEQEQNGALRAAPDTRLIRLAVLDEKYSRPPTGFAIYEMRRRGEGRAKAIYYRSSSMVNDPRLTDEMTRIFSEEWNVCTAWSNSAPPNAHKVIAKSCYRVFREPVDLKKKLRPL